MLRQSKKDPLRQNTSKLNTIISSTTNKRDRSLVDPFGGQVFQLSQQQINFINTEPNEIYEISMSIRNVGEKSRKIKVKKPSCDLLTVMIEKDGIIASGLQNKITITYNCDEIKELKDSFFIVLDHEFEVEIPINVYPVLNNLEFQPFINFGFIKCGSEKQIQYEIANKGVNYSFLKFNAQVNDGKVTIKPNTLEIKPKDKAKIYITISSKDAGEVEGIIDILPKQVSLSSIDFVATFCEFNRFITDEKGTQVSELQIQPLFQGQKIAISSFIVNNTPKNCDYRIIRQKGSGIDDSASLVTPQEFGRDDEEQLISFHPSQGEIQPYCKKKLKGEIMAKIDENDQQLFCNYIAGKLKNFPVESKEWIYTMKTYFHDEEVSKTLIVKGLSYIPKLCLTPLYFEFFQCGLRSKSERVLKIQNFSIKKVKINIQSTGNYSFHPNQLEIETNSFKEIIVRFSPQVIGDLNQIILLKVGAFAYPLRMFGKGKMMTKGDHKFEHGEELKVEDMQNTFLNNQISQIHEKMSFMKESKVEENSLNSTIHFDLNQSSSLTTLTKQKHKKQHLKKTIKNRQGKLVKVDITSFDPNEQIEEYPSIGRSPQEDRIVGREMTLSEMRNVPVGPVLIDFGNVFLGVILTKTFHVCNFNLKPISIQLETHGISAFEKSSKTVQILPPQSHGGLPITYEAIHEGNFKHSLQYLLNGKHYFELVVTGNAIPPAIQVSRTELKFIAGEEDRTFEKKQTIMLTNVHPYEVNFMFKNQNYFQVQPAEGILKGNSRMEVSVIHCFLRASEGGGKIEEILKLKIKNGRKLQIKCSSYVPECNIVCRPPQINFKEVSIYKTAESRLILRNPTRYFTVFKIQPSKDIEDIVTFSTTQSHLAPDEAIEIVLKVISQKINIIDSSFNVIVRGGKKINIPLKANIIIPKVKIEEDIIDFGNVPVGGQPGQKFITLVNDSSIPAQLDFIFQNQSIIQRCLNIKEETSETMTVMPEKDSKEHRMKIISAKINGKSKGRICLEFSPEEIKNYTLTMPLFLKNCNENFGSIQRNIICKSIKNKLIATQKQINFGKIIIEQSLDISSKSISFNLKNLQQTSVQWWINEKLLFPFFLEDKKGTLQPNEEIALKVFFSNENPGIFQRQIQFYINQHDFEQSKPYLKIPVKAIASFPEIHFNVPYVILPVVRLNEESIAEFQIINEGYENLNLKHVANPDFSNISFAIKYPKGCNLGITKKSIPVEVSFISDKPISFTVKVDFYDHHNRIFSILVSGTADNSLYTVSQMEWGNNNEMQIEKNCNFLATYLSSLGFVEDPLYNFPGPLTDDDYEKFQKFLTCLSTQYEKMDKIRQNAIKKTKKGQVLYEYLMTIIKTIKSEGGFLNQIRPELLMSYDDYLEIIRFKDQGEQTNSKNISTTFSYFKLPTLEEFQLERKKAWIIFIYQIFKVTSRIPLKKKNNQFWSQFIQKQKIIIQWLQNTYQVEAGLEEPKSCNGLKDIGDGQMLSALLSKYTNIRVLEAYGRIERNVKEKEKRCRKIMDIFTQIGLVSGAKVQDILRSNPRQMLIFLQRLYLILPSYLQKGEPVIFSCALGQSVTKTIQITNPSKYPVTYVAKIEGSKAYLIEGQSEFQVESKKSYNISLKYISNINVDKENATLTLTGKGSTKFTPSTFIFVLKSNSLGRISQKNVQITAQLYEPHQFQLNVKNNFSFDGDFIVQILATPFKNNQKFKSLCCLVSNLKIKKNSTSPLTLTFFPFTIEKHKFFIIFKDPNVGEFQYELTAIIEQPDFCPQPLRLPYVFFTNKVYTIDINVPLKNELLLKARKQAEGFLEKAGRKNGKKTVSQMNDKTIYPPLKIETYTASLYPQTDMLTLKNDTVTLNLDDEENYNNKKKLCLQINMKLPVKDAPLYLFLKNATGTDLRRYKLFVNSIYKPLRYEMQMRIPVNQKIVQALPLINISQTSNTFNIGLVTNEVSKNTFSITKDKQISVPAHEQGTLEVEFHPKLQQTYNAILKIENISTGQNIDYQIVGFGEQPVAQVYKFSQYTQQKKEYQLKIPYTRPKKMSIMKFTLQQAKYNKSFYISNEASSFFKFQFSAKFPGLYQGVIHIEDEEKIHAYQILMNVEESIEGQIKIQTIQRTTVESKIKLEEGEWQIETKDPNITVDRRVTMQESGFINFWYEAAKTGFYESFIILKNDKLGQFKYKLNVNILQMPEIIIDDLKIELGSVGEKTITLENPQTFALNITGTCTNIESFYFQPQNIVIAARSSLQVKLFYRPTCLELEEGKIRFVSDNGIKWNYHLKGRGCLQAKEKVIQMEAEVGREIIESVPFVNPFKKQVTVYIFLSNEEDEEERFRLLSKGSKYNLNYMQELSVPIIFQAKKMKVYEGKLEILINEKIFWKYVLRVKTVSIVQEEPRNIKLPSRHKKQLSFTFKLPFLHSDISENQLYKCKITAKNSTTQTLIDNTCRFVKENEKLKEGKATYVLNFLSYRPFMSTIFFEVQQTSGCKWVFPGQLQFTTPHVDDQFQIITDINKATSVAFRLNNRTKKHAKFKAHFTSGSDMEFSLKPKTGDLEPYGREGTQFEVTFAPTQYKNSWNGKIIIETEESYWSYNVKGSLPHYNPPVGKSLLTSRTQNKQMIHY